MGLVLKTTSSGTQEQGTAGNIATGIWIGAAIGFSILIVIIVIEVMLDSSNPPAQ